MCNPVARSALAWPSSVTPPSFEVGMRHYWGDGVAQDLREAVRCFEGAVKERDPRAFGKLGRCLLYGDGCSRDTRRAVEILEDGEVLDDEESRVLLAVCLMFGVGVEKDEVRSIQLLNQEKERGRKMCFNALSCFYFYGIGVPQDKGKAMAFVHRNSFCFDEIAEIEAANQGLYTKFPSDCNRRNRILGRAATIVDRSRYRAMQIYEEGARSGDGACMFRLATNFWHGYWDGNRLFQDRRLAVDWASRSIETPFHTETCRALRFLSERYRKGESIAQDSVHADSLMHRALELGHDLNHFQAALYPEIIEVLSSIARMPSNIEFT